MGGDDSGLPREMWYTLLVCTITFMALFLYMYKRRVALEELREQIDELHQLHDDMTHAQGATR
jgi:hypothetical protein